MYVTYATQQDMEAALYRTNESYSLNLRLVFRPNARRRYIHGVGVHWIEVNLALVRPRGAGNHLIAERRGRNACWHAHRDFFVELLRICPRAGVRFLGGENPYMSFVNQHQFLDRYFNFPTLFRQRGAREYYQVSCRCNEAYETRAHITSQTSYPARRPVPDLTPIAVVATVPATAGVIATVNVTGRSLHIPLYPTRARPFSQVTDKGERLPEDDWS